MTGRSLALLVSIAALSSLSCQGEAPSGAPPPATSGASGASAASTAAMPPGGASISTQKAVADRIVVVGAPLTEIVYALGFGDKVIAVDLSSAYPPEAASKPRVGYQRTLGAEAILSQKPGMLLLAAEAGPPSAIEQLRGTGVPMHVIPSEDSLAGAARKIRDVAAVLGVPDGGEELAKKLQAEADASKALLARVKSKPRVVFVYSRAPGALMVAGRNTPADAMITLAGGENPITGYEGFKALTAESLTAAAPDVLLVPEHSLQSLGGVAGVAGQPGAALTPAGKNGKVVAMEDALVIGFGPRTGAAIGTLARLIHPELASAPPDR